MHVPTITGFYLALLALLYLVLGLQVSRLRRGQSRRCSATATTSSCAAPFARTAILPNMSLFIVLLVALLEMSGTAGRCGCTC